jgi:drug/metabolite transporter (DMT)-like permease
MVHDLGLAEVFMKREALASDLLLLLTAAIWGFAFAAQRVGMEHVGPFTFNGVRFLLGAAALVPVVLRVQSSQGPKQALRPKASPRAYAVGGLLAGCVLFAGASLQQVGLVYTTAGKAGFITGLYVVFVPLLGLFAGQRPGAGAWLGASAATVGMYLLSINESFSMDSINYGDALVLACAVCFALHVLLIGYLAPRLEPVTLSCLQFAWCGALSLITAAAMEDVAWSGIAAAGLPILYGGLLSVGVAYTLQVVAQRKAEPTHAAILLSMESVFAALGGYLFLDEMMSGRAVAGCALMLAGMLASQLRP